MIVQMIVQMSGGRYDDRQWPLPWHDFEVPDDEGRGLIRCGAAMEVVGAVRPEPAVPAAVPAAITEPGPAVPAAMAEPEPVPVPEPAAEVPAEVPVPVPGDPKAAWVDYAVSQGTARAEAEDMTKAQLQAAYGGRL